MAPRRRNNRRRGGGDRHAAAELQRIFPKDHVVRQDGVGQVGWVVHVGGGLQGDSENWIPDGHVVVQWLDDPQARVERVASLRPVERPLLPGCRVQYKGALGQVSAVERTAAVVLSESGAEINIPVRKLRPAGFWRYGDFVHDTSSHSVGRVVDVRHLVEVDSPSGKCTFYSRFNETLFQPRSTADTPSPNELCKHFPGQTIVASHEAWSTATWTKGAAPQPPKEAYYNNLYVGRHPHGTVSRCNSVSVKVIWTARVGPGAEEEWVVPDRLKTVPWMWEDGYFPTDHVFEIKNSQPGVIRRITSRVDVHFADGTSAIGLRGVDLTPLQTLPNTFLPPNHVMRNSGSGIERGVVRRAQPEDSTCDVYWMDRGEEERVSYFELKQDQMSDIFCADTILKMGASPDEPPDIGVIRSLTDTGEVKVEWAAPRKQASLHQVSEIIVLYKDDWTGGEISGSGSSGQEDSQSGSGHSSGRGSNGQAAERRPQSQSQLSVRTSSESTRGESPDPSTEGSSDSGENDLPPALLDELTEVPLDDHRFSRTPPADLHPSVLRRELRILERGLPEDRTILVRTYASRTDLLRVLLLGPQDTPYADVPFVFDVSLPESYPQAPPRVLAHPIWGDERINPNLHADGKVCLSLLGTWEGPGWQPRVSTLLQVLISIQALILVKEPYFNEPGYELRRGTAEGQKNSRSYNEFARVFSLEAFVAAARRPVLGLVKELEHHFKRVGPGVLAETEMRAAGGHDSVSGYSAGFGMAMQRFQPRLEAALRPFNFGGEASPRRPSGCAETQSRSPPSETRSPPSETQSPPGDAELASPARVDSAGTEVSVGPAPREP